MEINKIYQGDALKVLKTFPDESVDCIITSPPYYGLRDYRVEGQIGLESTFDEYLDSLLKITGELKRVLKKTGTLWWNHGDSYGTGSGSGIRGGKQATNRGTQTNEKWQKEGKASVPGLEKCLLLQPYRLVQRMIDEQGWILRNHIIWHKPNCMPSSVKDRFTVDFEPIFFFTKSKKYWFETQFEKSLNPEDDIRRLMKAQEYKKERQGGNAAFAQKKRDSNIVRERIMQGRNKRTVWKIPTKPFPEAHFAVFPEAIIETPINAGCPEMICKKCEVAREPIIKATKKQHSIGATSGAYLQERNFKGDNTVKNTSKHFGYTNCNCNAGWNKGIVLDPFMGSGTTALVARRLGRSYIGIELSPEYIKISEKRLAQQTLL